jgi:DNA-binding transcriptional regulator YiaG
MMTFKELREGSGMNRKQFAGYFDIPYRTVQNWEAGVNKCPDYLLNLMEYKLQHEGLIRADMEKGK